MAPVILSWSSGKDSAWALHLLQQGGEYEVVALITSVDEVTGCVPVHGTQPDVLAAQADSAGLPLITVPLKWPCTNVEYERALEDALTRCAREFGARHVAFGDLFLEEIRAYRMEFCKRVGWEPLFPLWGLDTGVLAAEICGGGLEAIVCSVEAERLSARLLNRRFDMGLLAELPVGVDSCGENGEFHTIVVNSPEFSRALRLRSEGIEMIGSSCVSRLMLEDLELERA